MNIASTASTSQVQSQDAVSILMLKKALDQQQAAAAQMLAGLPQPVRAPDPSATVGRTIDTFA
ncbi:putative motility protein [Zoogloea sp.]|uniref:putative motility protein n=1 Tax=Zoogloea sp. TaxID=49181 RepID=UPI0035B23A52